MFDVLSARNMLADEMVQRREDGYDVSAFEERVQHALKTGSEDECWQLVDALANTQRRADWPYEEPSTLADIEASLPAAPLLPTIRLDEAQLRDRLQGAWLGRCAGCNLGKPVEGWTRASIREYLELTNSYPLDNYFIRLTPIPDGYTLWTPEIEETHADFDKLMGRNWEGTTRGNIAEMARDDDIDYTILSLYILETYGFDFHTEDVAQTWLTHLPFLDVYTAERAAYRNLVYGLHPPQTASYRNPYREWIGAQIRADMYGYVSPGNPTKAARLAYKDAALSHTQNGIYGEMWAAALLAACFVVPDMPMALEASLAQIPPHSRLVAAIRDVMAMHEQGMTWGQARDAMETRFYGTYNWVHTINNAVAVVAALLWGEGDFTRTIGLAVQSGWDTDCNGATAGSAFGAMYGKEALPSYWIDPLHDSIRSAVSGFDNSKISELAERTLRLVFPGQYVPQNGNKSGQ